VVLLAFTNVSAYGEGAEQPAGGGDNLTVTIELPRSSPRLQVLTQPEIDSATVAGVVRLRVPVASGRLAGLPLAEVDGDTVTVSDFRRALLPAGEEEAEEPSPPRMKNPMELLERLVNIRLVAREAREIGLDEIPEIRNLVDVFSRRTLREHLILRRTKGVEADEAEVEKLYKEAILEWRIKAILFKEEKDAAAFREAVLAGAAFDVEAGKYISEGKAKAGGGQEGAFVKPKDISPEMTERIGELAPGSVSPVVPTKDRFAVIRLEDVRLSESVAARALARRQARNFAQNTALGGYLRELNDRYVKLDKELFEKLDFGGTVDNFERMREDGRVVAGVEGEEPVTVSQLAQGIREQYYHGMGKAIEDGTINEKKGPVLTDILYKRITLKEAMALGLDKTPEFVGAVADYENSVLFGTFVERVLRPDIKISPGDLREYYEKHVDEYSYPEMVQLRSLSFRSSSAAQTALDKLRKGTDFQWMKANAEGQVQSEDVEATRFTNELVTVRSLPDGVRQALEGVGEGTFVLYRESETYAHALYVEKRILSRAQSFEDVRSGVLTKVYEGKQDKTLKDWMERLRNAYGAKVYAVEFGGSAP
jgi:hypothetical protein